MLQLKIILIILIALAVTFPYDSIPAQAETLTLHDAVIIHTIKTSPNEVVVIVRKSEPTPQQIMREMLEYIAYQQAYLEYWDAMDAAMDNTIQGKLPEQEILSHEN